MQHKDIYLKLKELLKNSYSPYSKYPVASLVETPQGLIAGVNVENGSYGLTMCAERSAIFNAVSQGQKDIGNIYLITKDNGDTGTPCGACLQVISEFIKEDKKIVVFNFDGTYKEYLISDMLPFAWSPKKSL